MANPVGTEYLNVPLTNFMLGLRQSQPGLARQILPSVPVTQQGAQYYVIDRGEWLRDSAQPLGRGAESAGGGWTLSSDTYNAKVYAYHKDNDDQDYANADAAKMMNLDQAATRFVRDKMQMLEDSMFASVFMRDGAAAWTVEYQGTSAVPGAGEFLSWLDDDSDPVTLITDEILNIAERIGVKPNVLIAPPRPWNRLRHHPKIQGPFEIAGKPVVSTQMLAEMLEIERIVVPMGVTNAAATGLADSTAFTFGDEVLLGYFSTSANEKEETAGALFSWTGMDGGPQGARVDRYRIPQIHSVRIEGFSAFDMKVTDPLAATLFKDTLAA